MLWLQLLALRSDALLRSLGIYFKISRTLMGYKEVVELYRYRERNFFGKYARDALTGIRDFVNFWVIVLSLFPNIAFATELHTFQL